MTDTVRLVNYSPGQKSDKESRPKFVMTILQKIVAALVLLVNDSKCSTPEIP